MTGVLTVAWLWTTWHTDIGDGFDHAVTDEDMCAGDGRYLAVCGNTVTPGSMADPRGPACPVCWGRLRQFARNVQSPTVEIPRVRHRKPGYFARWRRRSR